MVSVLRYLGIENEYGIMDPANPGANPVLLSTQLVTAYAYGTYGDSGGPRWDYAHEDPLQDARGFRRERASAHPSLLTDNPDVLAPSGEESQAAGSVSLLSRPSNLMPRTRAITNVITHNGARFYVDHAHPEYSGPETLGPRQCVVWDAAGDQLVQEAARMLAALPNMPSLALYKNNTDGKGASYGTHENYLMDRAVAFEDIVAGLTPFLVTRPIFCGAGRVGLGQHGQGAGFQLSQRADFIENDVGLETTLARPIINTRDEPHAEFARYRRLHVIVGDANLVPMSTYLKLGSLAALLSLLETQGLPAQLADLALADPVAQCQLVSRDLSGSTKLELLDGRELTALQIQRCYFNVLSAAGSDDPETAEFFRQWDRVLTLLETDLMSAAADVEWVAKLALLERMRARHSLSWSAPTLQALDITWSKLGDDGLASKLAAQGAFTPIYEGAEVAEALATPPKDTRAYFRGRSVAKYGAQVHSANWDSVIFDVPEQEQLQRVLLPNPQDGAATGLGAFVDRQGDAATLLHALR